MAKQYWLGEFFVDLTRNQISQHTHSQTLPPKALAVLTYLAEHQGKVVSYDALLNSVWPHSVVTPNTLQRSIAQLRKALGDNSKNSTIIKTHAKQGYSLELAVVWSNESPNLPMAEPHSSEKPDAIHQQSECRVDKAQEVVYSSQGDRDAYHSSSSRFSFSLTRYGIIIAIIIATIVFIAIERNPSESPMVFDDLRYLTATDDKEYGARYSPDGQYIVFNRYFDQLCINHLWAKDTRTLEEFQLTAERGTYKEHSLSPDGKRLVYIQQDNCTQPLTQAVCYQLMMLDFQQALANSQAPEALLRCENSIIKKPVWVDNQHIVMMQNTGRGWTLIRFSTKDQTKHTLFEPQENHLQHFAYSPDKNCFALIVMKNGQQYLEMLSLKGGILSSYPINIPKSAPRFLRIQPQFQAGSDELIFTYNGLLYRMTEQGDVHRAGFPFDQKVGSPSFHPKGDRLLLIKGTYDGDLATLSLTADGENARLSVFERSIEDEYSPRFQPQSDAIVFISERTGQQQIWLTTEQGARVISAFEKGTNVSDFRWDNDGKHLLVLADRELHVLSLDGRASLIGFDYPVTHLFDWDSEHQKAIANILVNGRPTFVSIDLRTLKYHVINHRNVTLAVKSHDGSIIFTDVSQRFWQQGSLEEKPMTQLDGQGSDKGFVIRDDFLYGINRANQLWSYQRKTREFTILSDVTSDIDDLTDIQGNILLVNKVVAAKKEVIELSIVQP